MNPSLKEVYVCGRLHAAETSWWLGEMYAKRHTLGWLGWLGYKIDVMLASPRVGWMLQHMEFGGHLEFVVKAEHFPFSQN